VTLDDVLALTKRIDDEFGCSVHICAEIEWLFHHEGAVPDAFFEALLSQSQRDSTQLESIGREKTNNPHIQQYEFRFKASDPTRAAKALLWLDEAISGYDAQRIALHEKSSISSGLHWHLHLLDAQENYQFFKQEDNVSPVLAHVLGGLLATMPAMMPYFAPSENSYARLTSGADHVPTKICWGGNNRTAPLRLPESVIPLRHIEHRVCGADADPVQSVWAILVGIHYGLKHQSATSAQCFGDANWPESDYPLLPRSADEVPKAEWLKDYLG
jgi:glutamine synthetase